MAKVQKTIDRESKITVIKVSGEFLIDQIIEVADQFYLSEITLNVILDLSKADMSALSSDQMERIITVGKKYAHLREGGKTAFVMGCDLGYGLARMYEAYSEIRGHSLALYTFKKIDEAIRWIIE